MIASILARLLSAPRAAHPVVAGSAGGVSSGVLFRVPDASANTPGGGGATAVFHPVTLPPTTTISVPAGGVNFTKPDGTVVASLGADASGNTTFDLFGGTTGVVDAIRFTAGASGGKVEVFNSTGAVGVSMDAAPNATHLTVASGAGNPQAYVWSDNGNGFGGRALVGFIGVDGRYRTATEIDNHNNVTPFAWGADGHGDGITIGLVDKLTRGY